MDEAPAIAVSGDSLRAFEAASVAAARLDSAVAAAGPACAGAMLVRHAVLTGPGDANTPSLIISAGSSAAAGYGIEPASRELPSLGALLEAADLGDAIPERVRDELDGIWARDPRTSSAVLAAAEAAGYLVVSAPSETSSQRAAALAGALILARGEIVSAPFLTVWQLDAQARSAAVQVDRSQSWETWVRAWCTLLAREAAGALRAVEELSANFKSERSDAKARARTGATDAAVASWLHANLTFNIRDAAVGLGLTTPTVGTAISRLEEAGVATELTGQQRDRVWVSTSLLRLVTTR
ncbi:MAG: hypothetical protein O2973_00165 [Gemmatimonadetes bacterium]|nr:hypothetical protein [Gemmatimonadota bacterium]